MTEREPISNLDPDHAALAAAQKTFRCAFVQLVRDPTNDTSAGALEAALDVMLHKLSNMMYGSTLRTVDYATATRNQKTERHGMQLDDHEHRLRMLQTTQHAMSTRQGIHAGMLAQLMGLNERVDALETELAALRKLLELDPPC